MTTTKSFRETVAARAANDLNFRYGLLTESLDAMLTLAEGIGKSPKSLMRMLSASGNPTAKNLFGIVSYLQQAEGVSLQTQAS